MVPRSSAPSDAEPVVLDRGCASLVVEGDEEVVMTTDEVRGLAKALRGRADPDCKCEQCRAATILERLADDKLFGEVAQLPDDEWLETARVDVIGAYRSKLLGEE